ncbi:MAG: hypothetical protein KDD48_03360 [Bdellovibrionales bacterium]|nr:hypothetical protein [Bdellovibrionales bacterium]
MISIWKKVALASIALWFLTVGTLYYFFVVGTGTKVDQRTEIALTPQERDLILGEMRQLLDSVRGIIQGVAENDVEGIQTAARASGLKMAQDVNPSLMLKLPAAFKELGMNTHQRFDKLADKAPQLSSSEILKETSDMMGSCVGCHVTYKITESK